MHTLRQTLVFALLLSSTIVVHGQDTKAADDAAIRQRLATYAKARSDRDARAEALCYWEDGDFRSSAGPFVTGREAIERQLIVNNPNYRFELEVVGLRFLTPDVAIAEANLQTGVLPILTKLVGSYIMVKRNGEWLIGAARIARAAP
jgi:uncharacterized protein (TIGR02246 family)